MHVQGVYETKMVTESYNSISDYISSMARVQLLWRNIQNWIKKFLLGIFNDLTLKLAIKSNAQVGSSAFAEEKDTIDSSTANSESHTVSVAASGQSFAVGASFQVNQKKYSNHHAVGKHL